MRPGAAATLTDSPNVTTVYTTQIVQFTGTGTTWLTTPPSFSITGVSGVTFGAVYVLSNTVCFVPITTGAATTDISNSPAQIIDTVSGAYTGFVVSGTAPAILAYSVIDNLTFTGPVTAGGANSYATGGQDVTGGRWSINASNKLVGSKASGNLTGDPWLFGAAGVSVNQEVSASWVGGDNAGNYPTLFLRVLTGGNVPAGLACVLNAPASTGSSFGLTLYYQQAGGGFAGGATVFNTGILYTSATDTYRLDAYAQGINPTTVMFRLTDVTTGVMLFTSVIGDAGASNPMTFAANDPNAAAVNAPGRCGLTQRAGTETYTAVSSHVAPYSFGLPGITRTTFNSTTISLSASAPTGTTGTVMYQWYRSLTPGFTPGAGSILAGQTATTLTDTPPDTQLYYYKVVATDSAATSTVLYSLDCPAQLFTGSLVVGWIGDSIPQRAPSDTPDTTVNVTFPTLVRQHLQQFSGLRNIVTCNQAVPSTTTGNWVVGGTYYPPAKAAIAAAGCTVVCIQLGTNDASTGIAASAYQANLTGIVSDLVSSGYKVIIGYPPYKFGLAGPLTISTSLLLQYQTVINSLVDNVHVFLGPTATFSYFAAHPEEFADGTHPTGYGENSYAWFWSQSIMQALYPSASSTVVNPGPSVSQVQATLASQGTQTVTIPAGRKGLQAGQTVPIQFDGVTYTLTVGTQATVPQTVYEILHNGGYVP